MTRLQVRSPALAVSADVVLHAPPRELRLTLAAGGTHADKVVPVSAGPVLIEHSVLHCLRMKKPPASNRLKRRLHAGGSADLAVPALAPWLCAPAFRWVCPCSVHSRGTGIRRSRLNYYKSCVYNVKSTIACGQEGRIPLNRTRCTRRRGTSCTPRRTRAGSCSRGTRP